MQITGDVTGRSVIRLTGGVFEDHAHLRNPEDVHDPRFEANLPFSLRSCDGLNTFGNFTPNMRTAQHTRRVLALMKTRAEAIGYGNVAIHPVPMITEATTPEDIYAIADIPEVLEVKTMPKHGTTGSAEGIADFYTDTFQDVLEAIAQVNRSGRRLSWAVHAEVPDPAVPKGQREAPFLPIIGWHKERRPDVPIKIEHISSWQTPRFIDSFGGEIWGGITDHHSSVCGVDADQDPHLQCMPYPGQERDREAILQAKLSARRWYGRGSDSAPHLLTTKIRDDNKPPASGAWLAPTGLLATIEEFERHGCLDNRLEGFLCGNARAWHHLPPITNGRIELIRMPWEVPDSYPAGNDKMVPYKHGQTLGWRLLRDSAGRPCDL